MWNHKYNLVVKTGTYITKDQQTKNTWETVGKILEDDSGKKMFMLKRSFNPAGVLQEPGRDGQINDHIIITMSEVKNNFENDFEEKKINKPAKSYKEIPDDDILF